MNENHENGAMTHRRNRNDSNEKGASKEIMALKAEVNDMRLELDNLHEQKTKLEL